MEFPRTAAVARSADQGTVDAIHLLVEIITPLANAGSEFADTYNEYVKGVREGGKTPTVSVMLRDGRKLAVTGVLSAGQFVAIEGTVEGGATAAIIASPSDVQLIIE